MPFLAPLGGRARIGGRGGLLLELGAIGQVKLAFPAMDPPVLAAMADGDTLSDAVTWGEVTPIDGVTITETRLMRLSTGGPWVAFDADHEAAFGETITVRAVLTAEGYRTKTLTSASQPVAGIAPTLEATGVLDGRTLTVSVDSLTGVPAPTVGIAMMLNGSPVTPSGTGPWVYTVPDSTASQTLTWTVTATNSEGSDTASGSETVAANLFAPIALTAPALSSATPAPGQTVTITEGTYSGTPAPTITGVLTLGGVDVSGAMEGLDYTIPAETADETLLQWSETASNGIAPDASQQASATVTVADLDLPAEVTDVVWDDETNNLSLRVNEAGTTLHYAIWSSADATPSYSHPSGWSSNPLATGSVLVPDPGETTAPITDEVAGADRLTAVIVDMGGNVTSVGTFTITVPAVSTAVFPAFVETRTGSVTSGALTVTITGFDLSSIEPAEDRYALLAVQYDTNTRGAPPISVTLGGVTLSLIAANHWSQFVNTAVYGGVIPSGTAASAVVTIPEFVDGLATGGFRVAPRASLWLGRGSFVVHSTANPSAPATAITTTTAALVGHRVYSVVTGRDIVTNGWTPPEGATERYDLGVQFYGAAGADLVAPADTNVSLTWTKAGTQPVAAITVVLKEAA